MEHFTTTTGILLMGTAENAITIIGIILMMIAFAVGTQWIMAKFFGTKVHGRFQYHQAVAEIEEDQQILMTHSKADIEEGMRRCERKGYVKTHTNILAEVTQLIREREHRTTTDLLKQGVSNIKNSASDIISKIGKDKYDQLEKLGQLREKGFITEDEFEKEKSKILGK